MKNKKTVMAIMIAVLTIICIAICVLAYNRRKEIDANNRLNVVTSFYPVYIATLNIADNVPGVKVTNLSKPETGCLHDYQLSSDDAKLLANADILLVNGGGMESFLDTKKFAKKYPNLKIISIDENLPKEELYEDNAHYWMNLDFYQIYSQKIAIALADCDSEYSLEYMENYHGYSNKIDALIKKAKTIEAAANGKGVILLHEAFVYLADELDMKTEMILDLDDGAEVSASDLSKACKLIEEGKVSYIIGDSTYGSAIAKTIEDETGLHTIFIDPLTTGEYDRNAYLNGMKANLEILKVNLRQR